MEGSRSARKRVRPSVLIRVNDRRCASASMVSETEVGEEKGVTDLRPRAEATNAKRKKKKREGLDHHRGIKNFDPTGVSLQVHGLTGQCKRAANPRGPPL